MTRDPYQNVRQAFFGAWLVIVGGDDHSHAINRLKDELHLAGICHCATRKSDASSRCFQHQVRRPDVGLVICLRGLTRTAHAKWLHRFCRWHGLPLLDTDKIPHPDRLLYDLRHRRLEDAVRGRCETLRSRRQRKGGTQ